GPTDADAALHQRAEHREEPLVGVVDVGEVATVLGDHRVAVQQVRARHPHPVEPESPVVHTVEPDLLATVLDAHTGSGLALPVPDRYDKRVHALGVATDDELREHDSVRGVHGRVADVVLAGPVVRGVDDPLTGVDVVGGRGAQRLHVLAVAALAHRYATQTAAR